MNNEIVIAGIFIVGVIFLCKMWNMLMMKQRKKVNAIKENKVSIVYVNDFGNLKLVGTGNDFNSDFEFIQAVKKVELPDEVRVKIYD